MDRNPDSCIKGMVKKTLIRELLCRLGILAPFSCAKSARSAVEIGGKGTASFDAFRYQ